MIMKFSILYLSILGILGAQDYLWPTEAGNLLSSNFGEFRDTHFHMGVDIKTNEVTGYPVVAIDDGYLSRMVTNFNGYGKALYITTKTGHIAVYAHLEKLSPRFEPVLRINQQSRRSYFVYQRFTEFEFPVTRGEIIGYTGNSGSSSGPHLHFEIRNLEDEPLNPLLHGLDLPDHLSPVFKKIAFLPRSNSTRINASPLPQVFDAYRDRDGTYHLPDTLHISGPFSIATLLYDIREGVNNKYQIKSLTLKIDDQIKYKAQYDHITYPETGFVNTTYDHYLSRLNEGRFHELFQYNTDPNLNIESQSGNGLVNVHPGYNNLQCIAEDHAGNISIINGTIFNHPVSSISLELTDSNENETTFIISPNSGNFPFTEIIPHTFSPFGSIEEKLVPTIQIREGKKVTFTLPTKSLQGRSLQVFGVNRLGAYSESTHWSPKSVLANIFNVTANLDILDIHQGLYLQVTLSQPIDGNVQMMLEHETFLESVELHQIQPQVYITDMFHPSDLDLVKQVKVVLRDNENSSLQQSIKFSWTPEIVLPGETATVLSQDKSCSMRVLSSSLYDTTAIWIEKVDQSVPIPSGSQLSDVYQLQPYTLALKDTVQIGIKYKDEFVFDKYMGIYAFDQDDQEWNYLTSQNHPRRRIITAAIDYFDAVTIIQDNDPPYIVSSFPAEGGYYHYQDVEVLRVKVDDDLSGIKSSEEAINLEVDGSKVYPEYQPLEQEISYRLTTPFLPGQHSLSVSVKDRVGHVAQKKILFRVN